MLVNTQLSALFLEDNDIGNLGLRSLLCGGGLNLQHLNLADNKLGPRGATFLGLALRRLTALTFLDLSYNDLGDLGASGLVKEHNLTRLVHLSLGGNHLTDDSATDIANSLSGSTTLKQLDIENNKLITQAGTQQLARLRAQCAVLGLNFHFPFQ